MGRDLTLQRPGPLAHRAGACPNGTFKFTTRLPRATQGGIRHQPHHDAGPARPKFTRAAAGKQWLSAAMGQLEGQPGPALKLGLKLGRALSRPCAAATIGMFACYRTSGGRAPGASHFSRAVCSLSETQPGGDAARRGLPAVSWNPQADVTGLRCSSFLSTQVPRQAGARGPGPTQPLRSWVTDPERPRLPLAKRNATSVPHVTAHRRL